MNWTPKHMHMDFLYSPSEWHIFARHWSSEALTSGRFCLDMLQNILTLKLHSSAGEIVKKTDGGPKQVQRLKNSKLCSCICSCFIRIRDIFAWSLYSFMEQIVFYNVSLHCKDDSFKFGAFDIFRSLNLLLYKMIYHHSPLLTCILQKQIIKPIFGIKYDQELI